jgi:hypothetical protein
MTTSLPSLTLDDVRKHDSDKVHFKACGRGKTLRPLLAATSTTFFYELTDSLDKNNKRSRTLWRHYTCHLKFADVANDCRRLVLLQSRNTAYRY